MINLQSSINELQKDYNRNCVALTGLERYYENNTLGKKKHRTESAIRYKIERRKLKARNIIIQKSIKSLEEKQQQLQNWPNECEINYKLGTDSNEELNHHIQQIQEDLIGKYKDLDVSIIKETLDREAYLRTYTKPSIVCTSILSGLLVFSIAGVLFAMFTMSTPSISILAGRIGLGISFFASSIVSGIAMHRENKKTQNLFQKLREEYKQKDQLSCDLYQVQAHNQIMDEIIKINLELQKQKRILEIKEQSCATEEKYKTQNMQSQMQEMTINQYGMYEDSGKQKCKKK